MAFPVGNRLKSRKDIDLVFRNGDAAKGSFLFIKFIKNGLDTIRFGFIIPAKIFSNATKRNRIKRRIAENIRNNVRNTDKGYDFLFVLRSKGEEDIINREALLLFKKIELIINNN